MPTTWLALLSWTVLCGPVAVAVPALLRMDAFRREAFGRYRRAVAAFMAAVLLGLAYYVGVVAVFWSQGWVDEMAQWPMPGRALALYAQSAASMGALAGVQVAGRHLAAVVAPPRRS